MELPHYEMGYWAACKLVSLIEKRDPSGFEVPDTTAPLPPFDGANPAKVHCTLIEKESVRARR